MKFNLSTSGRFYSASEVEKLKPLGFTFKGGDTGKPQRWLTDYAHIEGKPTIEINTLEELMAFVAQWGQIVLDDERTLEIYDDYRE